ncbi:hypothetical protein JVT61DRAFT_12662 [Boletus reticuloceps]|uniref:Uncharacterized protein n=1 Tax=Boletus reticuloceps TaxID=495285 RepID=A0A8I2YW04_9AGAM|nr:hypothetical protein JVT61DRAFT_12662 [Boletus reticuloceps]
MKLSKVPTDTYYNMLSSLARRLTASRSVPQVLRSLSTSVSQSSIEERIVAKLTERFSPSELAVQDISGQGVSNEHSHLCANLCA